MQETSLMERFADPSLFEGLTGAEKLEGGLITTAMGMGTTVAVLILIWVAIVVMSKIMARARRGRSSGIPSPAPDMGVSVIEPETDSPERDRELAAVIMAAIAAAEGPGFRNNLVIRKITRTGSAQPNWSRAGTRESIGNRKF